MTSEFSADDGVGKSDWTPTLPKDISASSLLLRKAVSSIQWKQYLFSRVHFEDFLVGWGKGKPVSPTCSEDPLPQQQKLEIFSFKKLDLRTLTSQRFSFGLPETQRTTLST